MTTIIAIETPQGVEIGCDSQATGGDKIQMEAPKVFTNNGVIYGVAGTALLANEIKYAPLPIPPADLDADRWVTTTLCPAIRELLESLPIEKQDGEYEMHVLAVVHDRAYEISGNTGWVRNSAGQYVAGSGGAFAQGALSAGASLQQALEIAAKHDPYTGYKLTVTTAKELLSN